VLDRALRQVSCVELGLDSPYVTRAIASWDRTWRYIEAALADGRPWLMGERFTLADLCYAPFIARVAGLQLLDAWLHDRPLASAWWQRLSNRPSFRSADVGPSAAEREVYAEEGDKIASGIADRLQRIRAGGAMEMALTALRGGRPPALEGIP
jgi:glutathione S-transferase